MDSRIKREASQTGGKGFRLQRLRAVGLMLDALDKNNNPFVYAAIEHKEDVFVSVVNEADGADNYYEEDKNYDPEGSFTFNSREVRNTLVSFVDLYLENEMSPSLFLGFYSTNKIGKENESSITKSEHITLCSNPLLEELSADNYSVDVIDCVKKYITYEYSKQYSKKQKKGFLGTIKFWDYNDWKNFLIKISWQFGQEGNDDLEGKVVEKIKKCPYFSAAIHKEMEQAILDSLMECFDKKQSNTDSLQKLVSGSEVEMLFRNFSGLRNIPTKNSDPMWEMWNKMPIPDDKRNLPEKVEAVCAAYSEKKKGRLARKLGASKIEHERFASTKDFLSLKYRIYNVCEENLEKILESVTLEMVINEALIDEWFNKLKTVAINELNNLSKTYRYDFKSDSVIEGIILELFDSCFLSFDTNNEQ